MSSPATFNMQKMVSPASTVSTCASPNMEQQFDMQQQQPVMQPQTTWLVVPDMNQQFMPMCQPAPMVFDQSAFMPMFNLMPMSMPVQQQPMMQQPMFDMNLMQVQSPVDVCPVVSEVSPATTTSTTSCCPDHLPSVGSCNHHLGTCKPCAFHHKGKCGAGKDCGFCHFDHDKNLRKIRRKAKKQILRSIASNPYGRSPQVANVDPKAPVDFNLAASPQQNGYGPMCVQ